MESEEGEVTEENRRKQRKGDRIRGRRSNRGK